MFLFKSQKLQDTFNNLILTILNQPANNIFQELIKMNKFTNKDKLQPKDPDTSEPILS